MSHYSGILFIVAALSSERQSSSIFIVVQITAKVIELTITNYFEQLTFKTVF